MFEEQPQSMVKMKPVRCVYRVYRIAALLKSLSTGAFCGGEINFASLLLLAWANRQEMVDIPNRLCRWQLALNIVCAAEHYLVCAGLLAACTGGDRLTSVYVNMGYAEPSPRQSRPKDFHHQSGHRAGLLVLVLARGVKPVVAAAAGCRTASGGTPPRSGWRRCQRSDQNKSGSS